ncbi:hypothetical protein PGT21_017417 [Puccinia graminis f. sp. tritici]|uniref:Uncharacterized protein n=1 Tax=Puccinia graminis f. sp. tritici TaxID=56615 RepID=A0A5B0PAM7_PUCGR|nr:hypothetical protein PGT21_017417 [Puccinia graminis f. sp. tritici]KAA1126079.1 hypothetical protein PGTUg99_021286 [Puccinia graminis f. sp. tritici]
MQFAAIRMHSVSILVLIIVTLAWTSEARQLRPATIEANRRLPNRLWRRRVHVHNTESFVSRDSTQVDISAEVENSYEKQSRRVQDLTESHDPSAFQPSFARAIPIA